MKPADKIPPPKRVRRLDYGAIREHLRVTHPREAWEVVTETDKLSDSLLRSAVQVLNKGDYFACRRGNSVFAGWCLSDEEIKRAKGQL